MSGARRRRSVSATRRPSSRTDRSTAPRFWGWHRLRPQWATDIVQAAGVRPGELVLDLGAGDGALTQPLVDAGARVIAIELHPGRAQLLRDRFADQPNVQVVEQDLDRMWLPGRRFRVVANPPWSMAKQLIATLTAPRGQLVQADLVLQRGLVADLDRRGHPGPGVRQRFRTGYAASIPRAAFQPAPPGAAAVLRITR